MTGVAWAPKNLSVHGIEAGCEVPDAGSGGFLGSVTLVGFTLVDGRLLGVATVDGRCTIGSTPVVVSGARAVVPVSVQELSCDELELILGDLSIASAGMTVQTAGSHLFVSPGSRGDQAKFCAAARLAETRSLAQMLTPLSQLLFR